MATKVEFIDPKRMKVETKEGKTIILGFLDQMNYQINLQNDNYCSKWVSALFDKYYDGNEKSIWGNILRGMLNANLNTFSWIVDDKDKERERIGQRIRNLRKEREIDAKTLAARVGIDAGNLSRIEQGRFSVGLDILNKIAGALDMYIDFVPRKR
jgi:DNA-binding Xre family transcriptional regulator